MEDRGQRIEFPPPSILDPHVSLDLNPTITMDGL
jgi:hypothetical protein